MRLEILLINRASIASLTCRSTVTSRAAHVVPTVKFVRPLNDATAWHFQNIKSEAFGLLCSSQQSVQASFLAGLLCKWQVQSQISHIRQGLASLFIAKGCFIPKGQTMQFVQNTGP
jgi:hypothetical protein